MAESPLLILLATTSRGKQREIRQMAGDGPWAWRGLDAFEDVERVVEDGRTFAENARIKALAYAAATGLLTLADDSGLEVDALDGAPGVHSARFAGETASDGQRNQKLIELLRDVPAAGRTARFRCAMALARPGAVLIETEGAVEGRIVDEPRGENGFGYDPHFLLPELGQTMAELTSEAKNACSHRGQALRAMLEQIRRRGGPFRRGIQGLRD